MRKLYRQRARWFQGNLQVLGDVRRLHSRELYGIRRLDTAISLLLPVLQSIVGLALLLAIVLALFVGNDIEESSRFGAHWPLLEYVFDRSHLMLAEIPSRLLTMLRERSASGGRAVGTIQGEDDPHVDVTEDLNTLRARMPWLDDPSREQPTMTEATFLEVERRRAELVCSPGSDHAYAHCYAALDAILAAAGPTPLAVVLIPDEFQVEDSLWIRVAAPKRIRERAQMLLRTWLAARDVPVRFRPVATREEPPR